MPPKTQTNKQAPTKTKPTAKEGDRKRERMRKDGISFLLIAGFLAPLQSKQAVAQPPSILILPFLCLGWKNKQIFSKSKQRSEMVRKINEEN